MMETSNPKNVHKPYAAELTRGMRWRVVASIVGGTAWLIFFLLFVAFVPTGFTLFQSFVVIVVSVLALGGLFGAMWASYGMRQAALAEPGD